MRTLIFDLETDGLFDTMTRLHCVAAMWDTDEAPTLYDSNTGYEPFLKLLAEADRIVAHNLLGFDLPVLNRFFDVEIEAERFDTLVMCRALWHDIINSDFGRVKRGDFPPRLKGMHSLEAYGYRLKVYKGNYGKQENAWDVYTPEMAEYCKQDVVVLKKLYERILKQKPTDKMVQMENSFAELMEEQTRRGVAFNEEAAVNLMVTLRERKEELARELQKAFPPKYEPVELGKTFVARGKNKRMPGIYKGVEFCKIKRVEFNPGSRQQIAERLISKYDWEPTEFTPTQIPKMNETILSTLDYPEAVLLSEYMLIAKRLGQIADGNAAWLKLVKNGRIHGRVNSGGAVTGRCTHSSPNLAQIPAVRSPFGKECRELFTVKPGYKMVGCDASGLELRCLAHYLAAYDGGAYAEIVLHGDIHTANQQAAGLPERDMAKTFIYGWLYGAGPAKIGAIVGGDASVGARLQHKFMAAFPAVKKLKAAVEKAVKTRKFLKGLDGRKMRIRSEHAALNMLLQGAGALVMKRWLIEVMRVVRERGLDANPVVNCHDEAQFEVRADQAAELAKICEDCMLVAGKYFNFRIPIEGESKIGETWAQTH